MSRVIDAEILAAMRSGAFKPFVLFDMSSVDSTCVYTDCDIPIQYDGTLYMPRTFRMGDVSYSMARAVDKITLDIDNIDQILTSFFIGGTQQGEEVILYLAILDSDNALVGSDCPMIFKGIIDNWACDEESLVVTIANRLVHWNKETLNRHSPSCSHKEFGSDYCAYAGDTSGGCDRSYAQCEVYGNTDNFRGFRWLPGIMTKEFWWGRVQGEEPK